MNVKEQKIKEAYGDCWEEVKEYVCLDDGWCSDQWPFMDSSSNCPVISEIEKDSEYKRADDGERMVDYFTWRPTVLQGIEDNNGWHALSEEDFPEDELTVFWFNNDNGEFETASLLHCDFNHKDYTHWHVLPPKPPIY